MQYRGCLKKKSFDEFLKMEKGKGMEAEGI
jgi:hypothetical protein